MNPALSKIDPKTIHLSAGRDNRFVLVVSALLMVAAFVGLLVFVFGTEIVPFRVERPYLIPWVIATGAVIVFPIFYLKRRGEFTVVHPLVYAAGAYFFPIFFLGGWSLVFGLSNYYYLAYVNQPDYDFPLAFLYIILGFGGLSLGFLIPYGKRIGERISKRLPVWEFSPGQLIGGSIAVLIVGFYATLLALELGQIGYQSQGVILGDTGSLNFYLTITVPTSSFLLWVAFFRIEQWNVQRYLIVAAQVITAAFMLGVLGGKSSLLYSVIYFIAAFVLVRRRLLFRNWIWLGIGLTAALVVGFVYGTTFRNVKGSDERIGSDQYAELAIDALSKIGEKDLTQQATESFLQLAERLEIASSLAVVVSNYEALATYESAYGLDNNIWQYTWTAFIPRFLWKDKPTIADNYSYNELYFGYGGFGLAITAMGDLLRNFGPAGVPIGMFVLGFLIRIFYASLIEGQPFSSWRSAVYFIVLTKISYDSFYGEILPTVIRVAVIVIGQLIAITVISKVFRFRR